jgi:hypothetical protein
MYYAGSYIATGLKNRYKFNFLYLEYGFEKYFSFNIDKLVSCYYKQN